MPLAERFRIEDGRVTAFSEILVPEFTENYQIGYYKGDGHLWQRFLDSGCIRLHRKNSQDIHCRKENGAVAFFRRTDCAGYGIITLFYPVSLSKRHRAL